MRPSPIEGPKSSSAAAAQVMAAALVLAAALPAQAIHFAAPTDTIAVAGDTPTIGTAFTAEAILRPGPGLPVTQGIVFQEQYDSVEDKALIAFPGGAGGTSWNNPQPTSFVAAALAAGPWYHVAFVYDGCEQRIYVDGKVLQSRPYSGPVGNTVASAMSVGAFVEPVGGEFRGAFTGEIDSLRISNVARYRGAMFAPPSGNLPGDASTVLLYWFDEPPGSPTVADLSGNGHTGTLGAGFGGATSPTFGWPTAPARRHLILGATQAFAARAMATDLFRAATSSHFQAVYSAALFTTAGVTGPIFIDRIRCRGQDGVANVGGETYASASVQMSSSPLSYLGLSSTFAANQGAVTVVSPPANVQVGASGGTVPNSWCVDIPLATPFTYDPTLGLDLNIEFQAPAAPSSPGSNAALTPFATSYSPLKHEASCVTSGVLASPTGTVSSYTPVLQIDFTGPGGLPLDTGARVRPYGRGCLVIAQSFYQALSIGDEFDLADRCDATRGLTLTLPVWGTSLHNVTAGSAPIVPPTGLPVSTADDADVVLPLPFTFTHPGGSTNVVTACTNGYVFLAGAAPPADGSPTVAEFLGQAARLAPLWRDFDAGRNVGTNPAAGMYASIDTSNPVDPVALVTWLDVGDANTVAPAGHSSVTMQLALHSTGVIEFRYGHVHCIAAGRPSTDMTALTGLVGYSRGPNGAFPATDPGSRDLSAEVPFFTQGPDGPGTPLRLSSDRPAIGTNVQLTTSALPPTTILLIELYSLAPVRPGVHLAFLGAPFCWASIALPEAGSFAFAPPFVPLPGFPPFALAHVVPVPFDPAFMGVDLYWQSLALGPPVNVAQILTSNAVQWTLGLP